jgi:hypothetical protein
MGQKYRSEGTIDGRISIEKVIYSNNPNDYVYLRTSDMEEKAFLCIPVVSN